MNTYRLDVFSGFECIGSACPETCCAGGWTIFIDDATYKKYMEAPGEMGDRLRANIEEGETQHKFKLCESGRCPFLDGENLCEIYREIGPENMCFTCRTYPRETQVVTDNDIFLGFSLSCPEVTRLLFSEKDKVQLVCEKDGEDRPLRSDTMYAREVLLQGLEVSFGIIRNRGLKMRERLRLLLLFNDMLEQEAKGGGDVNEVINSFTDEASQLALAGNLSELAPENGLLTKLFLVLYKSFINPEERWGYLRAMATEVLPVVNEKIAAGRLDMEGLWDDTDSDEYEIYMEQLWVYLLFMNYMQSGKEMNIVRALSTAVYIYSLNKCFLALYTGKKRAPLVFNEAIVVFSHLAKYIEHNQDFRNRIGKLSEASGLSDTMGLIGLV